MGKPLHEKIEELQSSVRRTPAVQPAELVGGRHSQYTTHGKRSRPSSDQSREGFVAHKRAQGAQARRTCSR